MWVPASGQDNWGCLGLDYVARPVQRAYKAIATAYGVMALLGRQATVQIAASQ